MDCLSATKKASPATWLGGNEPALNPTRQWRTVSGRRTGGRSTRSPRRHGSAHAAEGQPAAKRALRQAALLSAQGGTADKTVGPQPRGRRRVVAKFYVTRPRRTQWEGWQPGVGRRRREWWGHSQLSSVLEHSPVEGVRATRGRQRHSTALARADCPPCQVSGGRSSGTLGGTACHPWMADASIPEQATSRSPNGSPLDHKYNIQYTLCVKFLSIWLRIRLLKRAGLLKRASLRGAGSVPRCAGRARWPGSQVASPRPTHSLLLAGVGPVGSRTSVSSHRRIEWAPSCSPRVSGSGHPVVATHRLLLRLPPAWVWPLRGCCRRPGPGGIRRRAPPLARSIRARAPPPPLPLCFPPPATCLGRRGSRSDGDLGSARRGARSGCR